MNELGYINTATWNRDRLDSMSQEISSIPCLIKIQILYECELWESGFSFLKQSPGNVGKRKLLV